MKWRCLPHQRKWRRRLLTEYSVLAERTGIVYREMEKMICNVVFMLFMLFIKLSEFTYKFEKEERGIILCFEHSKFPK
jgi:hypothetical protein